MPFFEQFHDSHSRGGVAGRVFDAQSEHGIVIKASSFLYWLFGLGVFYLLSLSIKSSWLSFNGVCISRQFDKVKVIAVFIKQRMCQNMQELSES